MPCKTWPCPEAKVLRANWKNVPIRAMGIAAGLVVPEVCGTERVGAADVAAVLDAAACLTTLTALAAVEGVALAAGAAPGPGLNCTRLLPRDVVLNCRSISIHFNGLVLIMR